MEPQLSVTCFRYVPAGGAPEPDLDALNGRIERLRAETRIVPSSTPVDDRFAIRPCFLNPRTTERDVGELVDSVVRICDRLASA